VIANRNARLSALAHHVTNSCSHFVVAGISWNNNILVLQFYLLFLRSLNTVLFTVQLHRKIQLKGGHIRCEIVFVIYGNWTNSFFRSNAIIDKIEVPKAIFLNSISLYSLGSAFLLHDLTQCTLFYKFKFMLSHLGCNKISCTNAIVAVCFCYVVP
jgi:hypothetical protein